VLSLIVPCQRGKPNKKHNIEPTQSFSGFLETAQEQTQSKAEHANHALSKADP
jgi:hypothetical protein